MRLQLRICTLAALLAASSPAFAQEDPPVPEDPTTTDDPTDAPPEPEPVPVAPVSESAPMGTVEVVEPEKPAAAAAAVAAPTEAVTEVKASAPEPMVEEEEQVPKLRTSFMIQSEGTTANNLDFRPLNNDTFIDIYDSDDRGTLLATQLGADIEYDVLDSLGVAIGASHSGLWGGDSLGSANAFGGVFYITGLNIRWMPVNTDSLQLGGTVGRQRFSIGGAKYDFFLDDVIDGVVLEAGFGKAGKLRIVPLDISAPQQPDDLIFAAGYGYADATSSSSSSGIGFNGDSGTTRFGGVYENTELIDGLHFRAFGYYADIGAGAAPHTGADKVFYGAHGNFSDNDYNWMGGTRIGYDLDGETFDLGIYGEFARSGGLDRKATQIGVRDVAADGNAFGGAVTPTIDLENLDIRLLAQFFMADGASHTSDEGLAFNYGFVGMKGHTIGGLNMGRYAGWRPSAYVGTRGVSHSPQDLRRKAGTMLLHGGVGVDIIEKVSLDFDLWWFKDNSSTGITDFGDNLDQLADELPFGYTQADLIPQERLGKALGMELDARAAYNPVEPLSLYLQYGVFMPGAFYEIEIPRTGGTALGADSPASFWALSAGTAVMF